MKVKYVGALLKGYIFAPAIGGIHFKKGVPIEVPDEVGENLLEKTPTLWKISRDEKEKQKTQRSGGD